MSVRVMVNVFSRLFGPYTIEVSQSSHLVGNFNAHLQNKLLVYADEAFWAGDKRAEGALKAIITEDKIAIEMKGIDVQSSSNFARLILASNNDWVVPAALISGALRLLKQERLECRTLII